MEELNGRLLPGIEKEKRKRKGFALLIDPDKSDLAYLQYCVEMAVKNKARMILVGGSLVFNALDPVFDRLRSLTDLPLVLFPGSTLQLSSKADAILFLTLISGRNPDYLIGNHVIAAPFLQKSELEVIPTGYILVDGGRATTVEYISQTRPIPANKPELAVATALAGEMLGQRIIYMDSGSGAEYTVPVDMIKAVAANISVPLIIGGGIRSGEDALAMFRSGADLIVIGNKAEENPDFLNEIYKSTAQANSELPI